MNDLSTAKRCPFCDGSKVWVWEKAAPDLVAIGCSNPDCAATGPLYPDVGRAIVRWNAAPRRPRTRLDERRGLAKAVETEWYNEARLYREARRGPRH